MNVLVLTHYFPPEIGSASHLFFELSESLVKRGHKVTVVTGFPTYHVIKEELDDKYRGKIYLREKMNGIQVVRLAKIALPRDIPVIRGLEHFLIAFTSFFGGLMSGRQDVILVYSPPLTIGITAYLLSKVKKIPFVVNIQDLFPQNAIDLGLLKNPVLIKIFESLEGFVYKNADYLTVHSEGNREYLISRGADPNKVMVIPNWIDTNFITPTKTSGGFREKHKLGNKFIVSFAGIMGYSQDLDTVIECAELLKTYEDILFLLVGDGVEKNRLVKKVEKLKLKNVKFLPMQPREKYPSVLYASNVCLVTLKKNVLTPVVPSKLLSIMASGRPVVASLNLNGDAAKLIESAKCGYSIEPENPEMMSRIILKLYEDPSLGEELGKNGRVYVEKNLSRDICTEKYERLLLDLADVR